MSDKHITSLIDEIIAVKRLLILQLISNGVQQKDLALMLGISEATMRRMIPRGLEAKKLQSFRSKG